MVLGVIGLLVMSIFGGVTLMWLICPTPPVIWLTSRLKFVNLFVVFFGWLGWL